MFNVALIGTSSVIDYEKFKERCIFLLKDKAKEGITIYATEETIAINRFATEFCLNVRYFYTDWKSFGKKALRERNKQLLASCNGIIWVDDELKDTRMLISMAKSIGTPTRKIK